MCLTQAAFLYGREYAKWEAGVIDSIGLPNAEGIARQAAEDPELDRQLDELNVLGQQSVGSIAERLSDIICKVHAVEVPSRWEGFGRFCREWLGMEAMVLMRAFGLRSDDVAEEVHAASPHAKVDEAVARKWASSWGRRFGGSVSCA